MRTIEPVCMLTLLVSFACASRNGPPAATAEAKSAVSAAEAVGAQNEPRAALHLKLARDQTAQAEALARDGKDDEARRLIERAKVDAELALVLTRDANTKAQVAQARERVQQLTSHD